MNNLLKLVLIFGLIVSLTFAYGVCSSHADCPSGKVCVNNVCTTVTVEPVGFEDPFVDKIAEHIITPVVDGSVNSFPYEWHYAGKIGLQDQNEINHGTVYIAHNATSFCTAGTIDDGTIDTSDIVAITWDTNEDEVFDMSVDEYVKLYRGEIYTQEGINNNWHFEICKDYQELGLTRGVEKTIKVRFEAFGQSEGRSSQFDAEISGEYNWAQCITDEDCSEDEYCTEDFWCEEPELVTVIVDINYTGPSGNATGSSTGTCTDSDGGMMKDINGTASGMYGLPASYQVKCDRCIGGNQLREYYCNQTTDQIELETINCEDSGQVCIIGDRKCSDGTQPITYDPCGNTIIPSESNDTSTGTVEDDTFSEDEGTTPTEIETMIDETEDTIGDAAENGIDTTEAEEILDQARDAYDSGDYETAEELIVEANEILSGAPPIEIEEDRPWYMDSQTWFIFLIIILILIVAYKYSDRLFKKPEEEK